MDQFEFEEEVRTVARALWPTARDDGAMNIDGVEHDGVYFTHDVVHCVEATVSRRKDKAEHDGKKLSREVTKRTGSNGRVARGWFVTLEDPTPEQTKALRAIDRRIVPISFNRFKARLFDARLYHQRRQCISFGSAINPTDRKAILEPYIPAEFHSDSDESGGSPPSFEDLITRISTGERFCIVGDYGMGKSMTLREIYLRLSHLYRTDETLRHPVHLNLRDHWGQRSPRVALTQHAEDLGYDRPDQIISAWRAGYVDILLDGFDEIAAPGWSSDVVELRHSRRRAVELVRNFFDQTDSRASVVVAGRRSYFDSLSELKSSLFDAESCTLLEVAEFNEQQVAEYLAGKKWYTLPDWLPKRPLLIGYLAAQNLLDEEVQETEGMNPAGGWDWLLEQISRREARIETGIDGETVRKIIERLASVARRGASSLGPLTYSEITEGFHFVRGREPSDDQRTILHRLPGLGSDPNFEEGTRKFIDVDLASAAQARDVSSFILNPFGLDLQTAHSWSGSLEQSGVEVAALQCIATANQGIIANALLFAKRNDLDVLSADVARVALASTIDVVDSSCEVSGVVIPRIDLYEGCADFSGVQFSHCLIEVLALDGEIEDHHLPVFDSCHFESVIGRFGENDLSSASFLGDCTFADFPDMAERNADVLRSSLPRGVRVMVTVLRKLYLQRGSGRAEGAFVRGMPQEDRLLVPKCLDILRRERLVSTIKLGGRIIWLPTRSEQKRVREFVTAPRGSGDELFAAAAKLS
ncbi:NACHT domain-containing protein [Streptomyces sp. NPDC000609]|uniref:NACHT domain-containing protein n=1 Tax=Streptomyces sp. NPDC000609 TaxID=3160957 RepID=UPI003394DCB1